MVSPKLDYWTFGLLNTPLFAACKCCGQCGCCPTFTMETKNFCQSNKLLGEKKVMRFWEILYGFPILFHPFPCYFSSVLPSAMFYISAFPYPLYLIKFYVWGLISCSELRHQYTMSQFHIARFFLLSKCHFHWVISMKFVWNFRLKDALPFCLNFFLCLCV